MKVLKKIIALFVVLIVLSLIGGYVYFNNRFTPPDNYLIVSGETNRVDMEWFSNEKNSHAALLLPIQIKGIDKVFYMQLDFGSPFTMFYRKSLKSLPTQHQKHFQYNENQLALEFSIENMTISSKQFRSIDYGDRLDLVSPHAQNIIGTIGTDLLEKRVVILNFKQNYCLFTEKIEGSGFTDFQFKKRKLLIPAKIGTQELKLLYDSGTSGYELITSKKQWEKYRIKNSLLETEKGNSWGNELKVVSAAADKKILISNAQLALSQVTYIEGTSTLQNMLMKLSGMQGMIGNKLFLNHKVIIDCKNEKIKVE